MTDQIIHKRTDLAPSLRRCKCCGLRLPARLFSRTHGRGGKIYPRPVCKRCEANQSSDKHYGVVEKQNTQEVGQWLKRAWTSGMSAQ